MGGNPPLGYDVDNRKLVVNEAEAETVRLIFQRYLDLGCVRLLCADLKERGMVSKRRMFSTGKTRGGKPIDRSALYLILNNRTYRGETTHKGTSYPGEHQAIVPRELFNAVQKQLAELRPPVKNASRTSQDALYVGLIFDETGEPMLPTYAIKRPGLRYRYYVSKPATKGERSGAVISRIPAPAFEAFMSRIMTRLDLPVSDHNQQLQSTVRRIEIHSGSIVVRLDSANVLARWRAADLDDTGRRDREIIDRRQNILATGETIRAEDGQLVLTLPVRARFRGGRAAVIDPTGAAGNAPQPDMALVKAIARAHRWRRMLLGGEVTSMEALAKRFEQDRGHTARTLNLAFLSPTITRAIIRGEQPPGLRLTHLLDADIPLSWHEQEAVIARL